MKITGVRTTVYCDLPSADSHNQSSSYATHALVELTTATALTGRAVIPVHAADAVQALARDVMVGADPRAAMGLWERMCHAGPGADSSASGYARAALDIAAWDLKARANDEPLWKALGGKQSAAVVHLGWDRFDAGAPTPADWLAGMQADHGIRSACVPLSGDRDADLERLAETRCALGKDVPDSTLMAAMNCELAAHDAIRHLRELERHFDLTLVRSPVRPGDYSGARLVSDSIAAAVCAGEGFARPQQFLPYFEHYAANVLELDISRLGVSGSVLMADAAFGFELPVLLTGYPGHVPVHLFAALPTPVSVELRRADCESAVVAADIRLREGRAVPGELPGNGLVINAEALEAAAGAVR